MPKVAIIPPRAFACHPDVPVSIWHREYTIVDYSNIIELVGMGMLHHDVVTDASNTDDI